MTRLRAALILTAAFAIVSAGPAAAHFVNPTTGSVRNGWIRYEDKTKYDFLAGWAKWDGLNEPNEPKWAADTAMTAEDLDVSDVRDCSASWYGSWQRFTYASDEMKFNTCNMDAAFANAATRRLSTTIHETGHAVGLGHSYCNEVMTPGCGEWPTTPQGHDKYDYDFLWG